MPSRKLIIPGAAAVLAAFAGPALSHPHVFAEARLDVTVDESGNVATLHHVWRFDDLFSSTVLVEFDKNKDMKLDADELNDVSETVYASLADYGYFQIVTHNGKDVAMQAPERLIADFVDNQLIILFESKPEKPLPLEGTVDFGVYDPTFYTAIDFTEDEYLAVKAMPASCKRSVVRPDADEAIAQNQDMLTDAFFNDPTGNDMSKIFATRLELNCGKDS
ncbi:DUF1007 family protein [Nitratireductor sp. ZSWI3]|uniref:DUF1007 family protein n=1 Tax=Nitratireductor sp. ZSWI3 TaxID=2966359 RepID=UPI00214FB0CC|nr:DUF1007 family protein [Nitratireductor sp. ZSWI3]MCR4265003.1 DUF1007 family protein [Nitratireductor sp. ZSWI3]